MSKFLTLFLILIFSLVFLLGFFNRNIRNEENGNIVRIEKYLQITESLKYLKEKFLLEEVNLYYVSKKNNNVIIIISSENIKMNYGKYYSNVISSKYFDAIEKNENMEKEFKCFFYESSDEEKNPFICVLFNENNFLFFIELIIGDSSEESKNIYSSKEFCEQLKRIREMVKKVF